VADAEADKLEPIKFKIKYKFSTCCILGCKKIITIPVLMSHKKNFYRTNCN